MNKKELVSLLTPLNLCHSEGTLFAQKSFAFWNWSFMTFSVTSSQWNRTLSKVILVLSDGLRYDAAVNGMGYLGHLVERKLASLYKVIGELPSLSRPMYETIHTGLPSSEHGIVSNLIVRRSIKPNVFQSTVEAGKTTAAAAYSWFSELYNRAPYDSINDREVDDASLLIQHGRFYTKDEFPDEELFATAALLVRRFAPDYLLVHPMGMDHTGETFGSDFRVISQPRDSTRRVAGNVDPRMARARL